MKKLPIGISTLRKIMSGGYAYVDKSMLVHELVESGSYYFLSRPRRFGKSLFIDTLKEAFEGNRDLFRGLWLDEYWDWDKQHPVIHISFGGGVIKSREELDHRIRDILYRNQLKLGVTCRQPDDIAGCFSELIQSASEAYHEQAVVLVDEYDKPILDNLTEPTMATEIRDGLRNFYSVIKDNDAWLRFALLAGVSKFSKVNLFSGLNNLRDITLNPRFSRICGYTESEMTSVFAEHLQGRSLEAIRRWYNGYSWLGEKVYNPYSILNYLEDNAFGNYWFESGTPTFLIDLFKKRRYFIPDLENIQASDALIGAFDVDFIEPENLLFQTGYLTIDTQQRVAGKTFYTLCYPNMEVKSSLSDSILNHYVHDQVQKEKVQLRIFQALEGDDPGAIQAIFQSLFSAIPHDWYRKNKLAAYEGYYASLFYCSFAALGLDVKAEDTTNKGRIDMSVNLGSRIFLFELKVVDIDRSQGSALEQLKRKGYAEKFGSEDVEVVLMGLEFDRNERNIVRCEWEKA